MTLLRGGRLPLVLQMTTADCGAACMTMILRGRGLKVSLNDCREQLGTGRDGVDVWSLVTLARSTGLEATAYRVTDPAALRDLPLPAIAHWEESHFVVIERLGRRGLAIVDPARGRRVVGVEEQERCLTGVVVTFGGPAKPPQPQWATPQEHHDHRMLRNAARLLRGAVARLLVLSLLLQVIGLALPVGTAMVFDHVLPTREADLLPLLALAIVGLVVTQFVLGQLRSYLLVQLQARVDREIMTKLLTHLLALPYRFFSRRSSGDLMQRLASSILLRELVTAQVLSAVIDGVFVMLYLVLLITRDVPFALMALLISGVQVVAVLVLHGRLMRLRHRQLTVQAEAEGVLMEALIGIATVKAMGAERRVYDNWQNRYSKALRMDSAQNQVSAIVENTASTTRLAAPLAFLVVGTQRLFGGELSLGEMLGLQVLALSMLTPLMSLVTSAQVLLSVTSHVQRLQDVFAAEPEVAPTQVFTDVVLGGRIELRRVSFRYDARSPLVLHNLDLTIEPGQKVAIVGSSGSGKSTLAMLLLGLYRPTSGEIWYDGVPLSQIDPGDLRRQFGVVMQESFIFRDSIRSNIALNRPDLPLERVKAAASVAALSDDIEQLPMRYETQVAERGLALSGGQRQRLAIARAVAGEPRVLLLDEATSHLDVRTERRVDRNISELKCTRVVIAHRLSTVRNADAIVVLDHGEIRELGSHTDLLTHGGLYADLVEGQSPDDTSDLPYVGALVGRP